MNRKRYFNELSKKDKYPVGVLSGELRHALGLQQDMLPIWIYRMRVLGYPPAWIKAAEMSTTLEVIDSTGKVENNPFAVNSVAEDGEVKDSSQYNKDSLIEFPGFNAPLPRNVKDDWLILGMPPLIKTQQLSEAVKSMTFIEPVPYKKSKLDNSITTKDDSLQDSDDSLSNGNDSTVEDNRIGTGSTTSLSSSPKDKQIESDESGNIEPLKTIEKEKNENSTIKVISMGTPVPKTIKPSLPSLEKWAVGMGELLHFENLPTSTGAYNGKIKGVITKVRNRFVKTA